jgi:hypothetical protein
LEDTFKCGCDVASTLITPRWIEIQRFTDYQVESFGYIGIGRVQRGNRVMKALERDVKRMISPERQ